MYFFLLTVYQEEKTVCTQAQTRKGAGRSAGGTEGSMARRHRGAAREGMESRGPGGTARFPARALSLMVVVVTGLDTKSCPTRVTPRTGALLVPLSVGFPREE